MKLRPWHFAGIILLLAVVGLAGYALWPTLTGKAKEEERPETKRIAAPIEVQVQVVEPRDFVVRAEATGHLRPWREVDLSTESGGRVTARPYDEGRRVKSGTVLLQIDDRDEKIELETARADLLKARADYAIRLNGTQAGSAAGSPGTNGSAAYADTSDVASARNALSAAETAFEAGSITQSELQQARRRFETARFLTGEDRSAVQAATSGLSHAEQAFERARLALDRTSLRAPFAGTLADVDVEIGQQVSPGMIVFRLLDDARMKVEVNVLDADVVHLRAGATARIRVPALDDAVFSGTIYSINPAIDDASGTARVTVAIPNPDGRLVSGLYSYVALETERRPNRIVVPADALLVRSGRDLVFVVNHNKAEWVYVTVGTRSGNEVEVLEGLAAGDSVAVAGHFALAHDAFVKAVPVESSE